MSARDSAHAIAAMWLDNYAASLQSEKLEDVISCFLPDGWLRDVLTFTWNNRALAGREKITAYLCDTLSAAKISNVRLDGSPGLSPQQSNLDPEWIASGFTFATGIAIGQGYCHLAKDQAGAWKAKIVLMTLKDLKGHEELGPEQGLYEGHTLAWVDVHQERRKNIEANPHVVIVGAGQTGLQIAARFRQMNIPALVLESNIRVGDNWRKRYPTLNLHTPRSQHSLLYQPYPANWPIFTPRDKLADWFEHYAKSQDLVIWTNSRPLPTPTYDFQTKRWSMVVDRNGTQVELNPAHIVLATGTLGKPQYPDISNKEMFRGTSFHAYEYLGGRPFIGKRVVVVGAGNTSADICQDLVVQGAQSVTMVQRSSTCVTSARAMTAVWSSAWPEGVAPEVLDLKFVSWPLLLCREMLRAHEDEAWARDKDMHEGLTKAGLKLNMGKDGSGLYLLLFERAGGKDPRHLYVFSTDRYWIDVGCAELISSGKVKVKQGVEPESFLEDAIVFNDGSALPADVVIFATGYQNIRQSMMDVFGEETIERTGVVWGLDEEGELKGCYRPSGHPGLWYGAGDFCNSRFSSKQLALTIKAIELGLAQF